MLDGRNQPSKALPTCKNGQQWMYQRGRVLGRG
jgi:hypothetical protein